MATQDVDGSRDLLLVAEPYFIQLDPARTVGADVAIAYLGRKAICGDPALVGSAEMQPDGRWRASVATDPAVDPKGYRRVAVDRANRFDAIVALWHARGDAFVSSHPQ